MDYPTLRQLIRSCEDGRIEYKTSTGEMRGALESACAFLNDRHRAHVVIGARNDGSIVGQDIADDTRHRLAAEIAKIEPVASIDIEIVDIPNRSKKAIVLSAMPAPELIPYTYDGRAYERVDNTTRRMSQQKYQRLLLHRVQNQSRWENGPIATARLADLDVDLVSETVIQGMEIGRIPDTRFRGIGDVIEKLNLRIDGKLTNAALALFAKEALPRFPQFCIKMGRFRARPERS
jgi:ATP-dependent DNA helicase RecG